MPAEQGEIIDTWTTNGLRGSGSHDWMVKDRFIPEERTFNLAAPTLYRKGPLYTLPNLLLYKTCAVALGIARGAIVAKVIDNHRKPRRAGSSPGQTRLGERNNDFDALGSLPRALIVEAYESGGAAAKHALEAMSVPSLPYLVTTRIIAGAVAVIPLYAIGLVSSYVGSRLVTVDFEGQSPGTYDHYFGLFLSPVDVLWSFLKVVIFSIVVILVHCYYGYRAEGGPAGVGVAVGRAVRTAIVMINIIDFFMSLAIWGATTTVRVAA